VHQDDVAAGEFRRGPHSSAYELAVGADEFEVEILHPAAGVHAQEVAWLMLRRRFRKANTPPPRRPAAPSRRTLSATA